VSPTEPPPKLGPLLWLAALALAFSVPSLAQGAGSRGHVFAAVVGAAVMALRVLWPRALHPAAGRLLTALDRVGTVVSTALLLGIYGALLVPYAWVLRRAGRLTPPDEPWPPVGSGWTALDDLPRHRRAAGSTLASLVVRAGGAAALVGFLWRRPSFFLVPLVLLLLLLSGVVLLGSSAGLGPLIYTLF
jgi:Family of unknown function (DUF5989)